jgi:hypothetical protein
MAPSMRFDALDVPWQHYSERYEVRTENATKDARKELRTYP